MSFGLGSWRFFLAFLVVISHLWSGMIAGPAAYAVWGFFVLSGFLMTHVLRHKYGTSPSGLRDFAVNRFLRIFPAYWIACGLGALALYMLPRFGVAPESLNPQFAFPQIPMEWWGNVTLLPLPIGSLLVPVSGALAVEVGAYMLMPLLAFDRRIAWAVLVLSLAANVAHGFRPDSFAVRYSSFLTALWVFALGSLTSHYRERLRAIEAPRLSVLVWFLHLAFGLRISIWPWTLGLYASVLLSAWVVVSLGRKKASRIDGVLGDLSYPLYLFHTVVGVFMWLLVPHDRSFSFFLLSLAGTLLISWAIVSWVDKPIDGLKRRRASGASAGEARS